MARNRYVVEITYKRAKEWHLLKEVIEVEDFYLMNAVWLWSMGFSNLCHKSSSRPTWRRRRSVRGGLIARRRSRRRGGGAGGAP